ncbi:MAG TPA: protein-glutamate O-methyltransferase CheR [Synergistales bacterium]|nr:protein-glutamate O-methyltransferase CheR [Synergistales bacterium]
MDQNLNQMRLIIEYLKRSRNMDLSKYKSSNLERKLLERASIRGCGSLDEYMKILEVDMKETETLAESLHVGHSRFFRDPLTFEYLGSQVLTDLALSGDHKRDDFLNIWSCGCYTGEEPYSVALLVKELQDKGILRHKVNIFATDIRKEALEQARVGCYAPESLENTRLGLVNRYFQKERDRYCLKNDIRGMVHFSELDLLSSGYSGPSESVFSSFDMILCRNVLLYMETGIRKNLFERLYEGLVTGGYLVLGNAEKLPGCFAGRMVEISEPCRIYFKAY